MQFALILLMFADAAQVTLTSQQLGPYFSMQECEQIKVESINKIQKDTGVIVKGSCIEVMKMPEDKEVKLYDGNGKIVTSSSKKN